MKQGGQKVLSWVTDVRVWLLETGSEGVGGYHG
jgi:hypothetical protein